MKKRINTSVKGRRLEARCAKELEEQGYIIGFRSIRTRFQRIDAFNLFDIIALSPKGTLLRFIQVKSNQARDKTGIIALQLPRYCHKELWVWKDRKGWKKERL